MGISPVESQSVSPIIGIIPARFASTRFPGKMLADLLGKSLLRRTYENACRSHRLKNNVVVATDDLRIFHHVKDFGGQVVMTSSDCPSGTDRVAEAVRHHFMDAEIIVNIQGDEPCLNPQVIDILVDTITIQKEAVLTTPVTLMRDPQEAMKTSIVKCVFSSSGRALYFSRSLIPFTQQGRPQAPIYRHIGVYCFRKSFLLDYAALPKTPLQQSEDLEQLKILEHGFPIFVSVVNDEGIGVDTWEDLKCVEAKLCKENTFSSLEELSPHLVKG